MITNGHVAVRALSFESERGGSNLPVNSDQPPAGRLLLRWKAQMKPLTTDSLCIRPFHESDALPFVEAARESVPSVGVWLPWCHDNYGLAEAASWFAFCEQNASSGSAYEFGVFSTGTNDLLGGIA